MKSNRAFIVYRCAALCAALIVSVSSPLYGQQKSGGITLQGSVEHSDVLPPVPDDLKAGAVFKDSALKEGEPQEDSGQLSGSSAFDAGQYVDSQWYRIPQWLAGTWPKERINRYYKIDYQTGRVDTASVNLTDISTFDYGYLPDSKGDIWDTPLRIETIRSDFGPTLGYSRITSNKIVSATDNQVIMESQGTLTVVDKRSHKILHTHQCEAIRTLTFVKDGVIAEEASQKDFDEDGHPLFLEKTRFASARSAPFDPSKGIADKHLVWLFGQFLLHNYWNDLVPSYYSSQAMNAAP